MASTASSGQRWVISVARDGYGYRALGCGKKSFRAAGFPDTHFDKSGDNFIRLEGEIIALALALDSWSVKHRAVNFEVGRGRIGPELEDTRDALQALAKLRASKASVRCFQRISESNAAAPTRNLHPPGTPSVTTGAASL